MGKWSKSHPAKKSVTCVCAQCGQSFETPAWRVKQGKGKYCGKTCYRLGSRSETGLEYDSLWFAKTGKNNYYWHKRKNKATVSLHKYVWEKHNGPVPEGVVVHHKDHNPLNNDVSNLELMNVKEHSRYHIEKRIAEGSINVAESLELAREAAKDWHRSEKGRAWHREHALRSIQKKRSSGAGV